MTDRGSGTGCGDRPAVVQPAMAAHSFRYELLENDVSRQWVAEVQSAGEAPKVIGMIVVWLILDEAHIATIAVHPEYRGRGIGRHNTAHRPAGMRHARGALGYFRGARTQCHRHRYVSQARFRGGRPAKALLPGHERRCDFNDAGDSKGWRASPARAVDFHRSRYTA